jgi:NADPH:quinone reductase
VLASGAVRAVVVTKNGGPEVLELRDEPGPEPGSGDLLVDVDAAGVNYRDVYERRGAAPYGGNPPFVAGVEGAGSVAAVGADVDGFAVGDAVAWSNAQGSYAERVVVPAEIAVPIPGPVSTEVAAAVLLQGMTAHYLAVSTYPVQPGDRVLVHAGAGGVGLLLIQIAKLRGGHVIATTSSEEKAKLARGAGADDVIGYDGFGERVRELTAGEGVVAVFDGIGKTTFDESLASLRPRGYMVLYGAASGKPGPLDPARLAGGSLFLTRPMLPNYCARREELLERAGAVFGWVASGELDVRIGGRYPLEEAGRAQEDLESRRTTGKLILLPARAPG